MEQKKLAPRTALAKEGSVRGRLAHNNASSSFTEMPPPPMTNRHWPAIALPLERIAET